MTPLRPPTRTTRSRTAPALEAVASHVRGSTLHDWVPLRVNSAYRTLEHHRAIYRKLGIKSVPRGSKHLRGEALDILTPARYNGRTSSFHADVSQWAKSFPGVGGVGYYRWGVHVDVRPRKSNGRFAAWASGKVAIP